MKASDIVALTLSIQADHPYFVTLAGTGSKRRCLPLAERLQATLCDPQRGWNIARCCAQAKLPLPEFAWPAAVYRAYRFCSEPDYRDETLQWAYALQQPEWWAVRDLVRSLLLSTDSTDQSISQSVQCPPEVIAHFEALWWSVRDRRSDLLYLAQLLNGPHTDLARKQMRVACLTNNSNLVLLAAGRSTGLSEQRMTQHIEQWLVTEAQLGQELGLMGKKENPALALLEQHLLGSREPDPPMDPLTRISFNKSMQLIIRQTAEQHMKEVLEAEHRLRAEEEKKAAPKQSEPPTQI